MIDECIPSEVALISIVGEFCRYLSRFLYRQYIIKQEKICENKYSEYVDAFVIKEGKKIAVSVYDGGDDLDDCGMEAQYIAPSNLEKGQAVIRYDEKERMLYIPRASSEGKRSKDECNVFKFDGNMFVRVDIE